MKRKKKNEGILFRITGLSGSGKTTIADKIKQFSIWFQAYFRHPSISAELENIVRSTLDNNAS